jgi:pimeloyl-ACP methyl ester carboxylesterase
MTRCLAPAQYWRDSPDGALGALPPVALYWGDRDGVIPVAHARAFESLVDTAMVTHFPGCGHFPQHERASELVTALGEFIDAPELPATGLRAAGAIARVVA